MRTVTTKPELLQPPADSSSGFFDDWFDRIEAMMHEEALSQLKLNRKRTEQEH